MREILYLLLTCPDKGLLRLRQADNWRVPMGLFAFGGVGIIVSMQLLFCHTFDVQGDSSDVIGVFSSLLILLVGWVVYAAMLHFWASMTKAYGSVMSLFSCLSSMFVPWLFLLPVTMIGLYGGNVGLAMSLLMVLGIFLWAESLAVRAIRVTYRVNYSQGIAIAAGPVAATVVFIFILFVLGLVRLTVSAMV